MPRCSFPYAKVGKRIENGKEFIVFLFGKPQKTFICVLELKVDDTVDNALAQIDSKGYAIPYEADCRKVTKCGVSISSEARNITHWRIVDEDGNIVDEQKFLP